MNFVKGRTVSNNDTFLQKLALADGDGTHRVNRLDTLLNFFFELSIKEGSLHIGISVLCRKGDDNITGSAAHVLLDGGLNALLSDDQRFHSNEVTVGGDHVDHIVHLSSVATNLTTGVVGLMVMTNEGGQGVLAHAFGHSESHDNMHLGEVSIKLLLRHFIDTSDDVLVGLTDCFANWLEIPWMSRRTDGVPSLCLPLVTLFTRCCACLCTDFLRHVVQLGVSCGGYPTCRLRTDLPYLNGPHRLNATMHDDSATS